MSSKHTHSPCERRAFTLMELTIALVSVALLAVGIAQIFRATGQTVSQGKRLSTLTSTAAALERQLASDIASMTRDGFLVIRNQRVNNGAAVQGYRGDANPRPRRADELMFFASGEFRSQRPARSRFVEPVSNEARIWWGHGHRRNPANAEFAEPLRLDDPNDRPDPTVPPALGQPGGNLYASEWILARHATLLLPPGSIRRIDDPNIDNASEEDNTMQVGLQPAASHIFRRFAETSSIENQPMRDARERPLFSSGLVDIASVDLATVRTIVQESQSPFLFTGTYTASNQTSLAGVVQRITNQQAWMRDAMPADSDGTVPQRIRVEARPPNMLGIGWAERTETQRADQLMLASHAFMERCTDFIVEWSFGERDPRTSSPTFNQIVWYSIDRPFAPTTQFPFSQTYARRDGSIGTHPDPGSNTEMEQFAFAISPGASAGVQYHYFGFTDPTFEPGTIDGRRDEFDFERSLSADEAARRAQTGRLSLEDPDTIEWPWPKLLRVSITLADAGDPSIEQTFQFVFRLPERAAGQTN